jgi:Fe-S oxidoreductase/FAD/FMN-containing dehydrogenase
LKEKDLENDLREIVGERVTTSHFERWFYTSDLIPIPKWVKSLFKTMPIAIAKPKTALEIGAILSYCSRNQIPVVPRGGGSSGLFGAVPKKGGIVLDLMDLSQVIEVDKERELVTTEAGITWWELDKRLKKEGLTVRSYPSSARSATVGGWIMSSGLGIGSLKYGPVFEQLLSAEVVLADGTVKEYTKGQGLEWFFESEGILGILTWVSLRVRRPPKSTSHHLVYFDDIKGLFDFVNALAITSPCPYAIEIFDHKYIGLLKAANYKINDFGSNSGVVLVTYDGDREEVDIGRSVIGKLTSQFNGEAREGAEEEWKQRFNMLRIRRAAPTIIPSSVHVPLTNLNQFYSGLNRLKKRPIGLLGHVVSNSECMVMPMLVSNEKKAIEYTFALHTPREISNLALSFGGKPGGGLGVWNAPYKDKILSKQKVEEIKKRKRELDPKGILNLRMWLDPPLLFRPSVYQLAMAVTSKLDRIFPTSVEEPREQGFEREFAACVQCGYCMSYCPTRQQWLSTTPRGRILMTKYSWNSRKITRDYVKSIFRCSLCGRCKVDCCVGIKSPDMWVDLRSDLVKNGFELDSLKAVTTTIDETHNIASKPNDQRTGWSKRLRLPYELEKKAGAEVIYFVGCLTSFYPMVQDIARSFAQILDSAGIDFTTLGGEEWCCGYPLISAGHKEAAAKSMQHNIDRIKETGAKRIVMTCPGCYRMWTDEYYNITGQKPPFEISHSTEFIVRLIEQDKIKLGELSDSITYHDPCDLGRNTGIYDEPRHIINKIPGLSLAELEDNREYCSCCGSGGDLLASNEDLSLNIARRKVNEVLNTGVQTLVTACPACVRAITIAKTAEKAPFNILDITQMVWKAMRVQAGGG